MTVRAEMPPLNIPAARRKREQEKQQQGEAQGNSQAAPSHNPEPGPLPSGLPPVAPFDPMLLPRELHGWVVDIADRMQCPADYAAVGAVVAISSVVGRQIAIMPKRYDDWLVVPNLWGAVVGRPGVLKTPALQAVLRPIVQLERAAKGEHEAAESEHEADVMVAQQRVKVAAEQIKKAIKAGGDAGALAREALADEPPHPERRRYMTSEPTVEKLGELLRSNPRGILLFRDELIGFLRNLELENRKGDRAFYLEAWNGDGRFTFDRIGRGTVDIEAACVAMLGALTPGPLTEYTRGLSKSGSSDDGLIQRYQLFVWPDAMLGYVEVDRPPDRAAQDAAFSLFRRLDRLVVPAHVKRERDLPCLRFDDDAQALFTEWRSQLEIRLRTGDDPPAVEAHLAKYRSLVPSLALLFHIVDHGVSPIGREAMLRASAWAEYLETHARRIYDALLRGDQMAVRVLGKRIARGDLGEKFTARDVYRRQWSGLANTDDVQSALDILVELNWLKAQPVDPAADPQPSTS